MDIRAWLQNTVDREPPDQRDDPRFPDFLQPQAAVAPPSRKYRSRRMRPAETRETIDHSIGSDHARRRDRSSETSRSRRSYESRESVSSSPDRAPAKTYEKRARHKTKADRYEPKKKQKRQHKARESAPKERRRKSQRSGDGGRTAGVVQSFQLKNGPKNSRLTLRPDVSAGIFRHGRSSAPMAGRGLGLPDLVFNEMKFLQNPTEHQDELPTHFGAQHQTKASRKQREEAEISAYFSAQRPSFNRPEAGRDSHEHAEQTAQQPKAQDARQPDHAAHSERRPSEPLVDLTEKSFLGFGSRGPRAQEDEPDAAASSHVSWSESVLAKPPPPPARDVNLPAARGAQERPRHVSNQTGQLANKRDPSIREDANASIRNAREDQWIPTRRGKGPAVIEVFKPREVAESQSRKQHGQSTTRISSASLPKAAPPSGGLPLSEEILQPSSQWSRHGYRTSDILKIGEAHRDTGRIEAPHADDEGKENADPQTSTPTSKLLRRAFLSVPQAQPQAKTGRQESSRGYAQPSTCQNPLGVNDSVQDMDDWAAFPEPHADSRNLHQLPQRGARISTASRSQSRPRSRLALKPVQSRTEAWRAPPAYIPRDFVVIDEEQPDELLDDMPDAYPARLPEIYALSHSRQVKDFAQRLASDRPPESYADPHWRDDAGERLGIETFSTEPLKGHATSYDEAFRSEMPIQESRESVVQETPAELVGFWRPNVLY